MNIIVKAGKVIDGTGAEPIEKGAVLVHDKTILKVGRQDEVKAESGTDVLDVGNKTVVPGLIDCHVHFLGTNYHRWIYEKYVPIEVTKSMLIGLRNAERCIRAGVLTVRDGGCGHTGIFEVRSQIRSGQFLAPRLLASGLGITTTGGHGWRISVEGDGENGFRGAVREMLRWGADSIKFMVTGGGAMETESMFELQMTKEELAAGVDEAKKRNKRTLAHVNGSEGALACVEAGVDSIEHGIILDNHALDAMKKTGSFFVPTLVAYWGTANRGPEAGMPEFRIRRCRENLDSHKDAFQRAYKMNMNIATGTDLGSEKIPFPEGQLGEGLLFEMELMVKYGMTPMDAIKAATQMSACNLGIEESVGTLGKGKLADLVIVDGDPLEKIGNLRRVSQVMKEGRIVYES